MAIEEIPNIMLNAAVISGSTIIIGTIVIIVVRYLLAWKKYNTVCIIVERGSGGIPIMSRDVGGVFIEKKTNNKRFFLKKHDVGLEPDNVPYMMNDKGQKIVWLLRTGLKNFRYMDIKIPVDFKFKITVGEEDLNWALNAYERHKHIFGKTLLDKLLPYIALSIVAVFILAMFAMILRDIGVLRDVAVAFEKAAQTLAQAKGGTVVIQ